MSENPFSDLPDVLEARGFTPRELGAVHVALDAATIGPDGVGCVDLWMQAAFSGTIVAEARIAAHEPAGATIEVEPAKARIELVGGEVRRVRFALHARGGAKPTQLRCLVDAPLKQLEAEATRIRPPWKLLDTVVQPDESAPRSAVDLLPVGLYQSVVRPLRDAGGAKPSDATRVERARMLPDFVVADVSMAKQRFEVAFEEVVEWSAGEALAGDAPRAEVEWKRVEDRRETARCGDCGEHVDLAKARDLAMCPSCGARWMED